MKKIKMLVIGLALCVGTLSAALSAEAGVPGTFAVKAGINTSAVVTMGGGATGETESGSNFGLSYTYPLGEKWRVSGEYFSWSMGDFKDSSIGANIGYMFDPKSEGYLGIASGTVKVGSKYYFSKDETNPEKGVFAAAEYVFVTNSDASSGGIPIQSFAAVSVGYAF